MKKYIFIAAMAAVSSLAFGALIAHGHDIEEQEVESKEDSSVPTIVVEFYIEPPKVHKFAPDQLAKSMCQYNDKDSSEPIEKAIELCIDSKEIWHRF